MPALTVHHLEFSRSTRILWLLTELGVEYELKTYPRDKGLRAPAKLRELHPLGKSPVITHGDRVVAESGNIIEYLLDNFDEGRKLRPASGSDAFFDYRYWLHYAEGSLMSPLLLRLVMDKIASAPVPFFIKPIAKGIVGKVEAGFVTPELERHAAFLNASLKDKAWFAGDTFTAADIQMIYGVEAMLDRGRSSTDTSQLVRWKEACLSRPAYRHALEQGGPVMPG